jgi:L-aspartate oxidase
MWEKAGLVRTAGGLGEGLRELDVLEQEFGGTTLNGALTVARTVLEGALADKRSRGCHYRLDAQEGIVLADLPG